MELNFKVPYSSTNYYEFFKNQHINKNNISFGNYKSLLINANGFKQDEIWA